MTDTPTMNPVTDTTRAGQAADGEALVQARDLARTFDVSAPWLNRVL